MEDKLQKQFITANFITSSSLYYVINMGVGVLNYILIIYVSHSLAGELSKWTAISAWILLSFTVLKALTTSIGKKVSELSVNRDERLAAYFRQIKGHYFWLGLGLATLPLLIAGVQNAFGQKVDFAIYYLLSFVIFTHLLQAVETQLLLGVLQTTKSAIVTLVAGIGRFVFTLFIVALGVGIHALPLGYIFGYLLGILVVKYFVKQFSKSANQALAGDFKLDIRKHYADSLQVLISLTIVSALINIDIIAAEHFFTRSQADFYAVLSNIGQLVFFASTAFMNAFIVHIARTKNLRDYWLSVGVVIVVGLSATLVFWFGADTFFWLFNRLEYVGQGNLVALYSLFITVYSVVFVSINFLIAKNRYQIIYIGGLFILLQFLLLLARGFNSFEIGKDPTLDYIWINLVLTSLAAIFFVFTVSRFAEKSELTLAQLSEKEG